jgi:beta-RFAP synthase
MIRVETGSRLHFGLFNIGSSEAWSNVDGERAEPARRFGGVGLMVESPGVALAVEPAQTWSASGPLAERALEFAHRFARSLVAQELPPHRLTVECAAPEHAGLGTGTQLGIAVAEALAVAAGHPEWSVPELAARVGRGQRSGIGVHGYRHGGFIIDGGKRGDGLAPLLVRESFPSDWRVVVLLPSVGPGVHGSLEQQAFDQLTIAQNQTDVLCRLVLLGMLPALREHDCRTFGEALYDFNARVGDTFAPVQGGRYAHPGVAAIVADLRSAGLAGVGQSSWGPAVFAIVDSAEQATHVANAARKRYGGNMMVWVTAALVARDQ